MKRNMILPQKRLFTKPVDPKNLVGRTFILPDLAPLLQLTKAARSRNWKPPKDGVGSDWQAQADFEFPKGVFKSYLEEVHGKKVKRIYFPLVYVGTVAKTLADSGYDVLTSDINESMVDFVRARGLRSEVRSFEEIPDEKIDLAVSFEPYPVSDNVIGYLGMLGLMARSIPFISIESGFADLWDPTPLNQFIGLKMTPGDGMHRIAYDYGSKYSRHEYHYSTGTLLADRGLDKTIKIWFYSTFPTSTASKKAAVDLLLIGKIQEWIDDGKVSIRKLAQDFSLPASEVAPSIDRIFTVLGQRFGSWAHYFFEHNLERKVNVVE